MWQGSLATSVEWCPENEPPFCLALLICVTFQIGALHECVISSGFPSRHDSPRFTPDRLNIWSPVQAGDRPTCGPPIMTLLDMIPQIRLNFVNYKATSVSERQLSHGVLQRPVLSVLVKTQRLWPAHFVYRASASLHPPWSGITSRQSDHIQFKASVCPLWWMFSHFAWTLFIPQ